MAENRILSIIEGQFAVSMKMWSKKPVEWDFIKGKCRFNNTWWAL